jgi:hypothetical protein
MAPNVGSSPRRIHRRISGYVPADGTQVTEPQASMMWNYFFPGPLMHGSSQGFELEGSSRRDKDGFQPMEDDPSPMIFFHKWIL